MNVPTGPCVPQVVPAKVLDACSAQGLVPGCCADLFDGFALEREHDFPMLADLLLQNRHGFAVEGHRNRSSRLCLVWMHPRQSSIEIDG